MRSVSSEELKKLLEEMKCELAKNGYHNTYLMDEIVKILGSDEPRPSSGDLQISDFVPEFIDKLIDQLKLDHNRWGNTWLNRPKEGQELRTLARYTDYFDMFKNTGEPINWLAVVGGALICWIRDNHPELCIDANEIENVKKKHNPSTPWSGCQTCRDEGLVGGKPDIMVCCKCKLPKIPGLLICKCCGGSTYKGKPEVIGVKVSPDGAEYVLIEDHISLGHKPGCAVHNNPPAGFASSVTECDCHEKPVDDRGISPDSSAGIFGAFTHPGDKPVEDMTVKELVEAPTGYSPIAHVVGEKIIDWTKGKLAYSPANRKDGLVIIGSVVFTRAKRSSTDDRALLGVCDNTGSIVPTSENYGISGLVVPSGLYRFDSVKGLGTTDTIYVSYDYEYELPKE